MKLRYIYIIVLCILTSGCNYLDIMPDERAKLEDSYNTPSKTEGFLYSCYTYMPMTSVLKIHSHTKAGTRQHY